ncbi:TadE/TadG family type IV pilus assembly protein [Rhizobiaceae sp. 2RAB30]
MSTRQSSDASKRQRPKRFPGPLGLFLRNRTGSTAIEFTLLALPFCGLVFAILESCVSFAGQEVLANTADDLARQMRTGQLKPADVDTDAKLRRLICDQLEVIVAKGCPGLAFDLREVATFRAAADLATTWSDPRVQLGKPLTKNVLRVTYPWPSITNYAPWFGKAPGEKLATTHFTMAVWQIEPYED